MQLLYTLIGVVCLSLASHAVKVALDETCTPETEVEIERLLAALYRSVRMFRREDSKMLLQDVAFSIVLVRINLLWIKQHLKDNHRASNFTASLADLITMVEDPYWEEIPTYLDNRIVRYHIWAESAQDFKETKLKERPKVSPEECQKENLDKYADWEGGEFSGEMSDDCLTELVQNSCKVSDKCWHVETEINDIYGYATSHSLLYVQLFSTLGCDTRASPEQIRVLKEQRCQNMYFEAQLFSECGFNNGDLSDLFSEHVSQCILEGYTDFARKDFRSATMDEEDMNECYDGGRHKRAERKLRNGCYEHLTGVRTETLSGYLRALTALCYQ